jgi:uncharacterized integral membrane protein (TIGR00698 family)
VKGRVSTVGSVARSLPGIVALLVIGLAARGLATGVPVDHLVVAIIAGAVLGNALGKPRVLRPGIQTYKLWLEVGIVLLGAQLVLSQVVGAGTIILVLVVLTVVVVVSLTEVTGRRLGIGRKLRSLLGAGIGICGVSAVAAVATGIRARGEHVAYVVGTIVVFDAVTILLYPAIGSYLGLEPIVFGIWAGLTMFSTGPVAAAGFAYSADAGTWAVLTKLVRNSLIGILVVGYSIRFSNGSQTGPDRLLYSVWNSIPTFVVGFFLLMLAANVGIFSSGQLAAMENASRWAFLIAFVGLGFDLRLEAMRNAGYGPLVVTFGVFTTVSVLSLAVLVRVF